MKRKKRTGKIISLLLLGGLLLSGCGKRVETETDQPKETVEKEPTTEETETLKAVKIGASMSTDSKEARLCLDGFIKGMQEEGYEQPENLTLVPDFAGGNSRRAEENAGKFAEKEVDLVFSMGFSAAAGAHSALKGKEIPLLYAGVIRPDEAGLTDMNGLPKDDFTLGFSDKTTAEESLNLIRQIYPDLASLAFIYTVGNQNAVRELNSFKTLAAARGITIIESGIYQSKDVEKAALKLAQETDAFLMLSDDNTDEQAESILSVAKQNHIPVFANSSPQVEAGALAGICKDYEDMGKKAGSLAARLLKGQVNVKTSRMEVAGESYLCLNMTRAKELGIEFSKDLQGKAKEVYE